MSCVADAVPYKRHCPVYEACKDNFPTLARFHVFSIGAKQLQDAGKRVSMHTAMRTLVPKALHFRLSVLIIHSGREHFFNRVPLVIQ
jgi:hypothetical protein